MAETTPRRSARAALALTAARLDLNLPPEAPKNQAQINPNFNDYHSNPMEISSTFMLPDITDWWLQQEETHPNYADVSNVAHDISSIIQQGVGVGASVFPGQDIIPWRQSNTPRETLWEKVIVRQFAQTNNRILVGNCAALDNTETENELELKNQAQERSFHRMAKIHDFLEMWQGSQNLCGT